ncbi:hypothetical protein DFS33DRAFT_1262042, partial [Desarmillaria ectypa]
WIKQINTQLRLDYTMVNIKCYKKKVLKEDTILQIWHNILQNKNSLPDNWI